MHEQRKPAVDAGFKLMNLTHKAALRLTGGRWPKLLFGMPGVELHTIGRKSGQRALDMLTSPVHDDSRVVLVASKGGDDRDPQWYRNLRANPDVEITIDGRRADPSHAGPDGVARGEGRPVARHRRRLQGLRQLPEEGAPGHPGRDLRATPGVTGPPAPHPEARPQGCPLKVPEGGARRGCPRGEPEERAVRCGQCRWNPPARRSSPQDRGRARMERIRRST